jgi:uncharacterized RDD family membrane protein YckC
MVERPVIELRRARAWKRVAAWALDGFPFALLAGWLASWLGADLQLLVPALAALALAGMVYLLLCTWLLGATFGKRATGLRVVGPDGARPGLGRSARRAVATLLGVALVGIGPLVALFTRSGRALHDFAADTAVVEAP